MNEQTPTQGPATPASSNKGKVFAALLILLVIAGYFVYQKYYAPKESTQSPEAVVITEEMQKSAHADDSFTFSTEVKGKMCSMNACSVSSGKCTVLSGTVDEGGSCKLDEKQATPEAQGLLTIVSPN